MKSVRDQIQESFKSKDSVENVSDFMAYEPFDVQRRPDWVHAQMKADGVDLYEPWILEVIKGDPHPFQIGYHMSLARHRILLASTQSGKSWCALIDAIIMATRQVPYSMRYPAGVDTGVKRPINAENIIRWGRRSVIGGHFIDNNTKAKRDGTWDCGNIIGVGVYPTDKYCPAGKQIWIGTTAQALLKFWWPKMTPGSKCIIPHEFIDTSKGNKGYDRTHNVVHFINDTDLIFTTYESQYDKFEAEKAHACILDEEPPNEKILAAAGTHAKYLSIVETPYRGITYSEEFIFNKDKTKRPEVFHCCAYDSPYKYQEDIDAERKLMKPWEIKPRIWGLFAEVTGDPYYDRDKLQAWYDRMKAKEERVRYGRLVPQMEYDDVEELCNITVKLEETDELNEEDVWRIFELPVKGVGYVCGVDIAEGAENPADAADRQAVCIRRLPLPGTREKKSVKVASLRSTLEVSPFAHIVVAGCSFYNNALLAPESMRGYHNGAFMVEVQNYPYFYMMMTTSDATKRPKSRKGFVTNPKNRNDLFNFFQRTIAENEVEDPPPFKDMDLVRELLMAVVGKNGRCDHTRKGSLDTAVADGITLYVAEVSPEQIGCNKKEKKEYKKPFEHLLRLVGAESVGSRDRFEKKHLGSFI